MIRDEKKFAFRLAYYKFERKWTTQMQFMLKEYEEIRNMKIKSIGEILEQGRIDKANDSEYGIFIYGQFDTPETLKSIFMIELETITERLNINNIYINKSIMSMISKYEKILEDEIKTFLELLVPIFFNMLEEKKNYLQTLSDLVKFDVNNPHKRLPKFLTDHFEDR